MTLFLYHGGCYDGFGAAYAAWRALGDGGQYIPVSHGEDPPWDRFNTSYDVVIADFCYPLDVSLRIQKLSKSLLVIDHHKTAAEALEGQDFAIFDQTQSGAALVWRHFHNNTTPPTLLQYIQDADLWKWALPASREINMALRSYPMEFRVWQALTREVTTRLAKEGKILYRNHKQMIDSLAKNFRWMKIKGYLVPVVNAPKELGSDIGNRLCQMKADGQSVPFAAYYFDHGHMRSWGLRSVGSFDVSAVAKKLGGGGHKNAAGFEMKLGRLTEL